MHWLHKSLVIEGPTRVFQEETVIDLSNGLGKSYDITPCLRHRKVSYGNISL